MQRRFFKPFRMIRPTSSLPSKGFCHFTTLTPRRKSCWLVRRPAGKRRRPWPFGMTPVGIGYGTGWASPRTNFTIPVNWPCCPWTFTIRASTYTGATCRHARALRTSGMRRFWRWCLTSSWPCWLVSMPRNTISPNARRRWRQRSSTMRIICQRFSHWSIRHR